MQTRYIFVVGGVMSGIGKGVTVSSIARILKDRGLIVAPVKIDPYINVDAGTMNPTEHGEVFVTDDGMECDQDIGNYERFLDERLSGNHSITTGQVYRTVIKRERNLEYGGRCVEAVPDIPNEVINRLTSIVKERDADVVLVEIGGTVGEYQNLLYLETARLLKRKYPKHVATVLVSYLPVPASIGEMKTKPTQQAVRTLQGAGLQPDFIIARSTVSIDEKRRQKISLFCNVDASRIISAPDVESTYTVPERFERDRIGDSLLQTLSIPVKMHPRPPKGLSPEWKRLIKRIETVDKPLKIGVVGKYFTTGGFVLKDAYMSVIEALRHASWASNRKPELIWIDAESLEGKRNIGNIFDGLHGVVVPGGFGSRGVNGKIRAIKYAREHKIPTLGLCYGMQLMVVEYARNVTKLTDAHTTEIDKSTKYPVIDLLPEQKEIVRDSKLGASMRLGAWECHIAKNSISAKAYGALKGKSVDVSERHRHRYEVNDAYVPNLVKSGLLVSGINPKRKLVEIIELPKNKHPFFVGTQFHPELRSSPINPHPLFALFARESARRKV